MQLDSGCFHRLYLLLFLNVCSCAMVWAQVSGRVLDTQGAPLPYVTLTLQGCPADHIITFAQTNPSGHFNLPLSGGCDSLYLIARCLGFRSDTLIWVRQAAGLSHDFKLQSALIPEVLIQGKLLPVSIRGDTTNYQVAQFSDSTEFSVEDLLKKLPGFRVSESGQISINGKTVERVLLDGEDLFSLQYQLATRNIRADMISTVQSIEHYQENPLLKDIQESDRLVLNLKVRDDRKRRLSGSFTPGIGYGATTRYAGHSNLFSLSRKDKLYLIGNANNAGQRSLEDMSQLNQGDLLDRQKQNLQTSSMSNAPMLRAAQPERNGLPALFTRENQTAFGYYGHVIPVSSSFKIKAGAWVGTETHRQQRESDTRFILEQGELRWEESRTLNNQYRTRHVQTEGAWMPTPGKHILRFFIKGDQTPGESTQQLVRQQTDLPVFRTQGTLFAQPNEWFGKIEYSLKSRSNTLWQYTAEQDFLRHNYTLNSQNPFYALFFDRSPDWQWMRQNTTLNKQQTVLLIRRLYRKKAWLWEQEGGVSRHDNRLYSAASLLNNHGARSLLSAFTTAQETFQVNIRQVQLRTGGTYHKDRDRLQVHLGVSLRQLLSSVQGDTLLWAFQPRVQWNRSIGDFTNLTMTYGFRQALPTFQQLYEQPIFTDFTQLAQGRFQPALVQRHQAGARIGYNQRIQQYSWYISANWTQNEQDFGRQYQISPYLGESQLFRPAPNSMIGVAAGAERFFRRINSRFSTNLLWNQNEQISRVNAEVNRTISNQMYQVAVSYGSAFDSWFNVILNSQWSRNIGNNQSENSKNTRITADNCFFSAEIVLKPIKKLSVKNRIYRAVFQNERTSAGSFWASDLQMSWYWTRLHSRLELLVHNLTQERLFGQNSVQLFEIRNDGLLATPGLVLLQWTVQL
jgi:hypothetical protein